MSPCIIKYNYVLWKQLMSNVLCPRSVIIHGHLRLKITEVHAWFSIRPPLSQNSIYRPITIFETNYEEMMKINSTFSLANMNISDFYKQQQHLLKANLVASLVEISERSRSSSITPCTCDSLVFDGDYCQ